MQGEVDAVLSQRSLLADQNPLDGLADTLFGALRAALTEARDAYAAAYDREREALDTDVGWQVLDEAQRARILGRHTLDTPPSVEVSTPDAILRSLDEMSLATWRDRTAALPARFKNALTDAAREAEPEARPVRLRSATLRSKEEVEAWLTETRENLLHEIAEGP